MTSKSAIKNVVKLLEEGTISTEELLSNDFFKRYSSLESLEEFEAKFDVKLGKGMTKEKQMGNIIKAYTKFKNLEEMKNKAIEHYAYKK